MYIYVYMYIYPKDQSRPKVAWEQKLPISATLENTPKSCRSRLIWVGKSRQKKLADIGNLFVSFSLNKS